MYFLQCPITVPPRFKGNNDFHAPTRVRRPLLVTIKGGGGLPLSPLWTLAGPSPVSLFQEDIQGLLSIHLNQLHS